MAQIRSCPDAAVLKRLVLGEVAAPDNETLVRHVEDCDQCVAVLSSMKHDDTLVEMIRAKDTSVEGKQQEQEALRRLQSRLNALAARKGECAATVGMVVCVCSFCGKNLKIKSDMAGKKFRCPYCQHINQAPNAQPNAAIEAPTLPPSDDSVPRTSEKPAQTAAGVPEEHWDFLAPPQAADELGRLGGYRILQVLGAGGMGVVFKAEDPQLERAIALKAMLPSLAASASAKKRFLREAKAAAAIKHDHIVSIYQVGEDRGAPFLAMEFLEGEPLDVRLKRETTLPVTEVLRLGIEVADGLAAAHDKGLIQRDIKPGNIWLEGPRGRVKVLDFGLARSANGQEQLTQAGAIVGTPAFMAPEQAMGKAVDHRCDLFSLGCVLYRLCTGELPFKGADTLAILSSLAMDAPRTPQQFDLTLPPELSDLVMQLLAKDPKERPANAHEVAAALRSIQSEVGKSAEATSAKPKRGSHKSANSTPGTNGRRIVIAAALAVLFVPLFLWLGSLLIRVESKDGTLFIKTDDPTVAVRITPEGGATVTYGKERREINLKPGKYGIELAELKEGLKLSMTQFTIVSGDNRTIEVFWEKGATKSGNTVDANRLPAFAIAPFDEKQARAYQAAWAKHKGVLVQTTNSIGMNMVVIPPGKFMMGSPESVPDATPEEQPQHEVELTQPFFMAAHEATQEQFEKIMGRNPSAFSAQGTHAHIACPGKRLDAIFEELEGSPKGKKCMAMEGLIEEGKELISENDKSWRPVAVLVLYLGMHEVTQEEFGKIMGRNRRAAQWVLSVGGTVAINDGPKDILAVGDLPKSEFRLTSIGLRGNPQATDNGLANLAQCRHLKVVNLYGTPVGGITVNDGSWHLPLCRRQGTIDAEKGYFTDRGRHRRCRCSTWPLVTSKCSSKAARSSGAVAAFAILGRAFIGRPSFHIYRTRRRASEDGRTRCEQHRQARQIATESAGSSPRCPGET